MTDFLSQIWTAWNQEWGVTVATILSILAIAISAGEKFHRIASAIKHWKGWATALRWFRSAQRTYRTRKAKSVMHEHLEQTSLRIPIQTYENCLDTKRVTSPRDMLVNITPEKPSWLNDYFVATALDLLSKEGRIAKATLYRLNGFPPWPQTYLFESVKNGKNAKELIDERETESRCLIYQYFRECREEPRYEIVANYETISPTSVSLRDRPRLRDDAPSCARCWDKIQRESDIRRLVESITTYDLAATATMAVTGEQKELQEAIINTCIDSDCTADVPTIKKIVEQGIEIRLRQLELVSSELQAVWEEQATKEFATELADFIREIHASA